ncbi:MAG: hypothetical protein WC393_02870 [Candidatus Nanoarchaeia archaeon]|jgi:hypothetical protein
MISLPRFNEGSSKKTIEKFNSPAEALQELCQDCLRIQYPNFYVFSTLGRDGAIDGIQNEIWVECKICSEDKSSSVIQKWKDTENSLKEQLKKGKEKCQKQYIPWFSSKNPLKKYILFTNAQLPNENAVREVTDYISNVFHEISEYNIELTHLKDISIKIFHWRNIIPLIQNNNSLLYKWFWESWPPGMIPLNIEKKEGFRAFLGSSKLSYYSFENYEKDTGKKLPIKTEKEIINSFFENEKIGRIIIGPAGVGKTRLAFQIGGFAKQNGWIVFCINPSIQLNAINDLFQNLKDSDKVLLIIDYIELMNNFKGFVEEINNYNKKYGNKVFYIATCRNSYYYRVIFGESTHEIIELNIVNSNKDIKDYMYKVVDHILKGSNILNYEQYITICKGIPVLAVLLVYLYENKKSIDLDDILNFNDFGNWFSKHLKLTIPFMEDSFVAKFMLCLPIYEDKLIKLPDKIETIKNKLSSDGWIESHGQNVKIKYAIHDVITDELVICYCKSIIPEIQSFIKKSFEFAIEYDSLSSVLNAFERIYENEVLSNVNWYSLICDEIKKNPDIWKKYRLKLLNTSLLNTSQKIMLLNEFSNYWNDLFLESAFHQAIGWLTGWVYRLKDEDSEKTDFKKMIYPFIKNILNYIKNDYIICRSLELFPKEFCEIAYNFIKKEENKNSNSFILCAYIRSSYNNSEFEELLNNWFEINYLTSEAYHILKTLFIHNRKSELETEWFKKWLSRHINSSRATTLLNLYLKDKNNFRCLKKYFLDNIKDKKQKFRNQYIIFWIDYSDEIKSIENELIDLSTNENSDNIFEFIYKILPSKKFKFSSKITKKCLNLCKKNINNNNLWTLKKIIWKNFDISLAKDLIMILNEFLINLQQKELNEEDFSNINCIIYKLLKKTYNTPFYFEILNCFLICLNDNYSFAKNINVYEGIQEYYFFDAIKYMLNKGILNFNKDNKKKILNFIDWFRRWTPKNKKLVKNYLCDLNKKYPSDLWRIN